MPPGKESTRPLCWAPWLSLAVRANGGIYPCCTYEESFGTFTTTQDAVNAWHSEKLATLRGQLLRGEEPAACQGCFRDERAGSVSKRMKIDAHVEKERLSVSPAVESAGGVTMLEIAFSNLCNLTCVMCSSAFSSSWFPLESARAQAIGVPGVAQRNVYRIPEGEIDSLVAFASSIETLNILGGEPAFDPRCRQFLRKLAEANPYCDVNIVTNGTLLDEGMLEALQLFQKGCINLSIDGVGKVYEFVRGAPFTKVADLQRRLAGLSRDFLVEINPALGLYNTLNLPELIDWSQRLADSLPHLQVELHLSQFVTSPAYLSSHLLPAPLRRELAEKLAAKRESGPLIKRDHLKNFLSYISTPSDPSDDLLATARKATAFYNQARGFAIWEAEPRLLFLRSAP